MTSADQPAQNIPQTCSGCGRFYLPHQLHTCPSCGKQYCDKCYPDHNCQKPRSPQPNPHIALDQQEWYNKQPTPCHNCGTIHRADALRTINGRKICPDCILRENKAQQKRKNIITIISITITALIIIAVFSLLPAADLPPDTTPVLPTALHTPLPTPEPTITFNPSATIHLTYPDISKYQPPTLPVTEGNTRAEQIARDYTKWRGVYLANLAEYQLHLANLQFDTINTVYTGTWTEYSLENDQLEKYRSEINRLGDSLNTYLDEYISNPATTTKPAWRHQELPALQPYN